MKNAKCKSQNSTDDEKGVNSKMRPSPCFTFCIFQRRIVMDLKIMVGKPIIEETRIPIDAIVKRLAEGLRSKEILEDFPILRWKI